MLRKIYFVALFVVLSVCGSAFSAQNTVKYSGPLLTGCNIYQLGMDEFVLKLNGKNLPVPKAETDDTSLEIVFDGAQASSPESLKTSAASFVEGVPMLYGFEVQNLSADKKYQVLIQIDASLPLIVSSALRTSSGYTLRVKTAGVSEPLEESAVLSAASPAPSVIFPENQLPFRAETRTTIEFRDAPLQDVFKLK